MMQIALIAIGAGTTAALLFASVASGSIIATFLFYLAPLPIMIAALGWSHWAGLIAALGAASALGAVLGFYFFAAFLVGAGIPAWWLSYLALLARPMPAGGVEWYPIGRLLLWAALIGAAIVLIAIPNFGTDKESVQSGLRSAFERAMNLPEPTGGPGAPTRADAERLIGLFVAAIPPAAAVLTTLLSAVNLWLAGRIVRVSGRLRRPWPDLAAISLPPSALWLLAAAFAGSFLPDLFGLLSGVLAASLAMIFAILGFAVLHAITRGIGNRGLALTGAYAAVAVFGWPLLGVALLGITETAFNIRARVAQKRGPPPPSQRT
jgi:hypothetical protein